MSAVLEDALVDLRCRPHWGKLFAFGHGDIQEMYGDNLSNFVKMRQTIDPERKFTNSWLDVMLLAGNERILSM